MSSERSSWTSLTVLQDAVARSTSADAAACAKRAGKPQPSISIVDPDSRRHFTKHMRSYRQKNLGVNVIVHKTIHHRQVQARCRRMLHILALRGRRGILRQDIAREAPVRRHDKPVY